jgi:hypothetical protein
MATSFWQVMQQVEENRHRAEQLESAASAAGSELGALLTDIAVQRREIAGQYYALWQDADLGSISPLRASQPLPADFWDRPIKRVPMLDIFGKD